MEASAVQRVRRFNRMMTQRIGALNDRYMARGRPLGESRVLWEIGVDGLDVRALRRRLDLDSGYLSRLLRSLERSGLVLVEQDAADGRVRRARLTESGLEERATLDHLSDELAWSLLEPLTEAQRQRLVEAMGVVERLVTAGMVTLEVADPRSAAARYCIGAYFRELDRRFEHGFDAARSISADAAELTEPAGVLLVARLYRAPVGCGAVKFHGAGVAEIKRMWVDPSTRGLGLGRRILSELERRARLRGMSVARLETNRSLSEAISLYRHAGYAEVAPFNAEPYAHHWFEKRLDANHGSA